MCLICEPLATGWDFFKVLLKPDWDHMSPFRKKKKKERDRDQDRAYDK